MYVCARKLSADRRACSKRALHVLFIALLRCFVMCFLLFVPVLRVRSRMCFLWNAKADHKLKRLNKPKNKKKKGGIWGRDVCA